jgi:DNA-binding MarR family transcriptional regulator
MNKDIVNYLTEEQSEAAVAKFDERDILQLHSLSDMIKQHPPEHGDPLATELLVSIFRTAGMLRNAQEPVFRKHNMVSGAWRALGILLFQKTHTLPLHKISRMLGVTPPHVTGIIDTLEQEGLVERIAHPDDRRVTLAHLTDKGIERLKEISPEYNANVAAIFSPFSDEEKEQVLALLIRLRRHLSSDGVNSCAQDETSG